MREIGYCKGERGQDLEMGRERVGKGKEGREGLGEGGDGESRGDGNGRGGTGRRKEISLLVQLAPCAFGKNKCVEKHKQVNHNCLFPSFIHFLCSRNEFVRLLKQLLSIDPGKRITPDAALSHPFLTLTHLAEYSNSNT